MKIEERNRETVDSKAHEKILLVDDDPDQLLLFTKLLKKGGYEVLAVSNVSDALEFLDTTKIDGIVCDVKMPLMSGKRFVRFLRSIPGRANIPVLMISATEEDMEQTLLMSGADMFCPKKNADRILLAQLKLLLH